MTRWTGLAVAGCLALTLAQGAAADEAKAPPLSKEAAALAVVGVVTCGDYISVINTNVVEKDLRRVLLAAGYRVVEDQERADMVFKVNVSAKEEESFFNVTINGQKRVSHKYDLRGSLVSRRDSTLVDEVMHTFSNSDRQVPSAELERLEQQVRSHGKFEAYVRSVAQKEAEARRERERLAEEARIAKENQRAEEVRRAAEAEDSAWLAASSDACRAPADESACGGVHSYLVKYPDGRHALEAQVAIAEAEPKLTTFRDAKAWGAAKAGDCRKPRKSIDCDPLKAYLEQFPTGSHAMDAKAVLKGSAATVASLKKAEDQREAAQESIGELCRVLVSLDQVAEAEALQKRVDSQSGTVNLFQKRQLATARVVLGDQRKQFAATIAKAGVQFNRKRDCSEDQ